MTEVNGDKVHGQPRPSKMIDSFFIGVLTCASLSVCVVRLHVFVCGERREYLVHVREQLTQNTNSFEAKKNT